MRKQLIPLIITLLFFMGNNCFAQTFGGGSGNSASDPYLISTKAHLDTIATYVNNNSNNFSGKYFKMMNDIDMSVSGTFNPIGNSSTNSFRGNFNGGGHVISNLTKSGAYVGLFGYISNNATISNLGIEGGSLTTSQYGGALVAYAVNSVIKECYSTLSTVRPSRNGSTYGGLIGYSSGCQINNCYSRTTIINSNDNPDAAGGLIGHITNSSSLSNSYSSPLQGFSGNGTKGLLVGKNTNSTILNSYYDNTLSANGYNSIGEARTLVQMRLQQFAVLLNPNSQCSMQVWEWTSGDTSINNGLPVLYWQGIGTPLPSAFLDGAGTFTDPFLIRTVADMKKLSNCVNGGTPFTGMYFRLENNIVFNGSSDGFNPIGNVASRSFQGIFNGEGYVISNLTISSGAYVGLFGNISGATISNLGIEGFDITSSTDNGYAGALVGYANNSEINKCYSANSIVNGNRPLFSRAIYIGGLIGYLDGTSKINNSYSRASLVASEPDRWVIVDFTSYVGGLVAYISSGSTISNSYSAPLSLGPQGTTGTFYSIKNGSPSITNTYCKNNVTDNTVTQSSISLKDSTEMKSGCFVVSLNGSQPSISWFKAKSQVNLGYPVLSWQKLSDGITPAGFEGNCLGVTTFDGNLANPYKVRYVKDLIYISNMVANDTNYSSKYFQMLNDINYNNGVIDSSSLYNPIGVYSNNKPFSGNFNGLRNAIANYSFSDTTKNNIGLFGYIKGATIQKLGISNISIKARNNVGGLVGNINANSTLDACFVYGYINGVSNVGGLVGNATTASCDILQSFTNTTIDAQTNVGGIVGSHNGGTISNSYSNSEIYSSTAANNNVGGIIGLASSASNLTKVYSACKIIRNGTNTNFGKIKGNLLGTLGLKCFSRDSVFVNYTNIDPTGYTYTVKNNADLRNASFVSTLNPSTPPNPWSPDIDNINDGYPILSYQPPAVKPVANGTWPTTTASQVVIISGVKLKIEANSAPMVAYIKIQNGGLLQNKTNINFFGEYNRELYLGKWNLIGLSTYNQNLASLINYTDTSYKTFAKTFDYTTNNWSTTTTTDVNFKFKYGEGFLVMPNYSLDDRLLTKSRIVSKGVLFNEASYEYTNPTTAAGRFVSLANNYPANLTISSFVDTNSTNIPDEIRNGIQGRFVYVYDADKGEWNNNHQTTNTVTLIKPSEGFFIAASNTSGNFKFNKSQINNSSGAKNSIKSDLIYVKAFANNQERESFLEFNDDADNGFDFNDGLMLFGSNYNAVEPFFTIPTPEINDSTTQLIKDAFSSLPYTTELDLRSQKNNEVTLNFSNIPSNIHVYLLDSLLNKAQYLNEEPNYELQVNAGDNAKRLYVLFSYYKEDINEFFKPEVAQEIKIWNYNNNLNIEGRDLIRYELFDIMGNKLLEEEILDDRFKTQLDLESGIYIVRAFSSSSSKAQKISISRK